MYAPAVLVLGVTAPVIGLRVRPAGVDVKMPPVYTPVPDSVTDSGVLTDLQNGFPK